jgi:FMN-dependent NADH-azoreductase
MINLTDQLERILLKMKPTACEGIPMSLFRLDASIRGEQSVSRQVADTAESAWLRVDPADRVVRRNLALTPVPADVWPLAVAGAWTPADQRSPEQAAAVAFAGELADELVEADTFIFAAPLYNFGVSQHFKAWADVVLTDPRFTSGQPSAIAGRPAALIVTRGGGYAPGTPREGWDHATGWYQRILGDVMGLDLHISEVELTLADVNPSMDSLRPLAAESLRAGHESADKHGQLIAELAAAS